MVRNAPQALVILWQEGFFITPKSVKEIRQAISQKGCNPSESALQMAILRSDFLERKGIPGKSKYIQIHNYDDQKDSPSLDHLLKELKIHPRILEVSSQLFSDGHYASAILEAFKEVNNMVKAKSGLSHLDGKKLMTQVFSVDSPRLKWSPLATPSERDEQEGFMFLYMGVIIGIRNPKAHDSIILNDKIRAIEYLVLASLLAKRIDEAKIVVTR